MHRNQARIWIIMFLLLSSLLMACSGATEEDASETTSESVTQELVETTEEGSDSEETEAIPTEEAEEMAAESRDPLADWLEGVRDGSIRAANIEERLDWGVGYFLAYGSVEGLGMDNLIYNALRAYRRLERGEVSAETQTRGDKNLLEIADTLNYSPDGKLPDQIWQPDDVRAEILAHIVEQQSDLSPADALASGNVVGLIAPPAPESIGEKFLVYGQDTPDAAFEFVGVVIAIDATGHGADDVYSHGEWDSLTWLGDATGPFWRNLPLGTSDDPADMTVAKPGVLLINEAVYEEIIAGE